MRSTACLARREPIRRSHDNAQCKAKLFELALFVGLESFLWLWSAIHSTRGSKIQICLGHQTFEAGASFVFCGENPTLVTDIERFVSVERSLRILVHTLQPRGLR
jgi:hypothetical protein